MTEPASIRYKNPGAQWPGPIATKWGSTQWVQLKDGQGNKIAVFPTFVQGAAAQFDLWRSRYAGMTLAGAIHKWSGHNSSEAYAQRIRRDVGIGMDQEITAAMLASEIGWKFMKTQSSWEAGKPYPMTDAEWQEAQRLAFSAKPKPSASTAKKSAGSIAAGGAAATAAHQSGLSPLWVVGIGIAIAVVAFIIWKIRK